MSITPEQLERIMNHMNEDHGESLKLYAHAFAKRTDVESAKMVDLTRDEILLELATGERLAVALTSPVESGKDAHLVLVEMHKQAVKRLTN